MKNYTVCPSVLHEAGNNPFSKSGQSLMSIMCCSNGIKIYIDNNGILLDFYKSKLHEGNDNSIKNLFVKYLKTGIENNDTDFVEQVSINNSNYSDFREFIIFLSKNTSKKLLLKSILDYKKYEKEKINFIEPNDFLCHISGKNILIEAETIEQLNTHPNEANYNK